MTIKQKGLVLLTGVTLLIVSFEVGRSGYSKKTESDTKTEEFKKEKETKEADTHKHKVTTEVTKPDGTKETTTVEDTDRETKKTDVSSDRSSIVKHEESTETHGSGSDVTLSALAGTKLSFSSVALQPIYGGMINKKLIGPINMGLFGLSDGVVGVSLGVSF